MSMIVYKDGVMAADTQSSVGDMIVSTSAKKIHRLPDGSLLGYAGRVDRGQEFLRWAKGGYKDDDKPAACADEHDFHGAVVLPSGAPVLYNHDFSYMDASDLGWVALGVGFEFAFALHTLGWTAEQIIAHAIKHCEGVGGIVYALRLEHPPSDATVDAEFEEVEEAPVAWAEPPPDEAIVSYLKRRGLE